MSKDVEWKLRQQRGVCVVEAEGCAVEVEEDEHTGRLEFQPSVGSGRCRGRLIPPVCCTLERGGFLFMSKDVEWKLRQEERGVFGVEAEGYAIKVEEEDHGGRSEFQPSVRSGCWGSLEPAVVLYTGTRWFSIHVKRCGMEAETGAWSLWC